MRILFVGNGNQKHRGARYYDPGAKLYNGLIRNGHNVYWLSDRDIARSATPFKVKKLGEKYCNEYFLDVCRNFLPELIVLYFADIITPDTVAQARKILLGTKIAQFNVDPIYRPHNITQIKSKLSVVDATFITTAGSGLKRFSSPNGIVSFVPNPVDFSIDWPKSFESSAQEFDVFWSVRAPKGSYEGDPRIEFPLFLENSNEVKIQYFGMNGKPMLYDASYYKYLANSKMGINISAVRDIGWTKDASAEDLYWYSSDRISHYMGSGMLTFIKNGCALHEMFEPEKEAIFFDTKEELLDKILFYKANDDLRKQVAKAGWKKSHDQYNERLVAKYIIESTLGLPHSQTYAWPTEKY